jgi:Domain of unknown function (DUF4129)
VRHTLPPAFRKFVFSWILTATLGAAMFAQSSSPPAQSSPDAKIDTATYESQLDRYGTAIESNRHKPAEIERLRKSIPAQWTVRTSDANIVISNEWLRSELWNLEHHPKEADEIAARLEQHITAMRAAAAELDTQKATATDARAQLEKVLSRREFRGLSGPSEWQKLMARITQWLFEWITRLLSRLHINAKAGNVVAWTVIGLSLAFLCYWIWRRLRIAALPLKAAGSAQDPIARTSRQWLEEAFAAAERGDYREAIHCAYWAAIARLEDSGVLIRDRARTPRESLRQLDSRPSEQKHLRDLTRHFELIWYGYRPASADDWSGARAQLEQMGCLKASTAPTANS